MESICYKLSPLFTREMINGIIDETIEKVSTWRKLAVEVGVPDSLIKEVDSNITVKNESNCFKP
ncbi:hypothetical protein C5470_04415 [Photorhabdus stackebrandtii]|uniref:Uncharacterized protein n=1 Tax=Photorhabdus stackebrandtii TaxID=1123042 RepID=A0A7X5QK44_9GAMM|nr:hypothetical protein [Photorhabdus stackebrandtii]